MTNHDDGGAVFDQALSAASDAFQKVLDEHFGRTFDNSHDDAERVLNEYRASAAHLRNGAVLHLRTGLIDADFACWHSDLADENFADDAEGDDR